MLTVTFVVAGTVVSVDLLELPEETVTTKSTRHKAARGRIGGYMGGPPLLLIYCCARRAEDAKGHFSEIRNCKKTKPIIVGQLPYLVRGFGKRRDRMPQPVRTFGGHVHCSGCGWQGQCDGSVPGRIRY